MPGGAARIGGSAGTDPRLLIVTPDFPPAVGGIQLLAHRLATGLGGFDVAVVTLDQAGARDFDSAGGIPTWRVPASARLGAARNVALNAAAVRHGLRFRPDLVLSAHIVVSPAAAALRRLRGARTVQYFYAKEIADKARLAAYAARKADASVAISSYTAALLEGVGAGGASVRLIPPGVDAPDDAEAQAWDRPTFVTISRLADRYKGHDVLIQALPAIRREVPDVEWVVIGDGPLLGELRELARANGVADCIRFLGAVPDAERDLWMRRAALLAMPSRLPGAGRAGEGFGIVYLEAASYGKPVVAGNVAGAIDAVRDGETGLLVDPADAGAVGRAVTRLLLDPGLARRLGAAGAERATRFRWPLITEQVRGLLLEQLGMTAGPDGIPQERRPSSARTPA